VALNAITIIIFQVNLKLSLHHSNKNHKTLNKVDLVEKFNIISHF